MEQITLNATLREAKGHQVKELRRNGQIPAVLYGKEFKNLSLSIEERTFKKLFSKVGSSTIVNLKVEEKTYKVLVHEPQKNPVTDRYIHVDLYKVNMKEEIRTDIPLKFVGESLAVETMEGNLITVKDALEIECLPDKLVSEIEVDITKLKTFDDSIKVSDIAIPEGIKVLNDLDELVAQVTPPRSDEEMKAMEEESTSEAEQAKIDQIQTEAEADRAEKEAAESKE